MKENVRGHTKIIKGKRVLVHSYSRDRHKTPSARNIHSKKRAPNNRNIVLSPTEISAIKKVIDKNKLIKNYSIKSSESGDYYIIDVDFKTEEMDFGGGIPDPDISDFSIIFYLKKFNGRYGLTAYRSYHFRLDHKFDTLYRKKVKRFSTVLKNIDNTIKW